MREKIIAKIKEEIILLIVAGFLGGSIWLGVCYIIDIHTMASYIYNNEYSENLQFEQ